jgi:hypothetical protein
VDSSIATTAGTQTLTNKTIDRPVIIGRTDGGNAAAGNVGEFVESKVLTGAAVSLTSGGTSNVTSISLTAGDWDVEGVVSINAGATTSFTVQASAISLVSATYPTLSNGGCHIVRTAAYVPNSSGNTLPTGRLRVSVSSTTTVYLVASCTFTVSTASAYGIITARRVQS